MYLLGCDIGSSSIKASIVNSESGLTVASDFHPKEEAPIKALKPGWAEQNPDDWWANLKIAIGGAIRQAGIRGEDIRAIGISYQMHGLVLVDKQLEVLRPSIIWCDSRAVPYGEQAFKAIGEARCLERLLNSPGNFTAAKLAWVKENEPRLFERVYKFMLPGDFIAMRMTSEAVTTVSGLSEGIFWDFRENRVSGDVMAYFGFSPDLIPALRPTFGVQGELPASVASELGLWKGTPVTYRAGDQPNNALSLNVLNPGEIAATAGTSGVVYGVNGKVNFDTLSRVNTFAHVNHSEQQTRLGVLLCINGVGILNSWVKRNVAPEGAGYEALNRLAASVPIGSEGLSILPFGNGAERMLENRDTACSVHGLNFNIHDRKHVARAAQEGIVFSFTYGMEIMKEMGIDIRIIRAGNANMFLSPVFKEALAGVTGAVIELYDTNGAVGAAKGAGIGAGIYASPAEAFASLKKTEVVEPNTLLAQDYAEAYGHWKEILSTQSTQPTQSTPQPPKGGAKG
ncbi:MAG: carbohydrate kinase [Tannerellaceae bacterium]|nr:carbohydrate kinase [Tannerellaceae bacterium]